MTYRSDLGEPSNEHVALVARHVAEIEAAEPNDGRRLGLAFAVVTNLLVEDFGIRAAASMVEVMGGAIADVLRGRLV